MEKRNPSNGEELSAEELKKIEREKKRRKEREEKIKKALSSPKLSIKDLRDLVTNQELIKEPKRKKLWNRLFERSHDLSFENVIDQIESEFRDHDRIGKSSEPRREIVNMEGNFSLSFPASDVSIVRGGENNKVNVLSNLLSLGGHVGPLAPSDMMIVQRQVRKKDFAPRAFFNSLVHRVISLFYRSLKHHRLAEGTPFTPNEKIPLLLASLVGQGIPATRNRMGVHDHIFACYAGILSPRTRSRWGLEQLIKQFFGVKAHLTNIEGQWHELDQNQWSAIGTKVKKNRLNQNFTLGKRAWVEQCLVNIELKELSNDEYVDFLPRGEKYPVLKKLIAFYLGIEYSFRVHLEIKAARLNAPVLTAKKGVMLGWNFCLKLPDSSPTQLITTVLGEKSEKRLKNRDS